MVSMFLVRTISLLKLSLRTKQLYIKWLAQSWCLVKQSHVWSTFQNNVFGKVLLRMGLLCRAHNYLSNLDCAALRAMTGSEGESAVMLFGIFMQLFETLWRYPWFWLLFRSVSTPCPKGCVLNIDYQYDAKHIMLIDLLYVEIRPDQTSLFKILKTF